MIATSVVLGFVLGPGALGLVHLDPHSGFVHDVATLALVVILIRDGLEIDGDVVRRTWHLPARKLAIGMPITAGVVALAARLLTDLGWTECLLLGTLLSPTDPVLSSSVVTDPRVPQVVRTSLNLESGLNDGLALPPVILLLGALGADEGLGPLSFVFVAVYLGAIAIGLRWPAVLGLAERRGEPLVLAVKVAVFFVFGLLLTVGDLFDDGVAAVVLVALTLLVARPVAIRVALLGTGLASAAQWFMAWFGPKGVATLAFSIVVLGAHVDDGDRLFHVCSLAVLVSVVVHGATQRPAIAWLERRAGAPQP